MFERVFMLYSLLHIRFLIINVTLFLFVTKYKIIYHSHSFFYSKILLLFKKILFLLCIYDSKKDIKTVHKLTFFLIFYKGR